MEHIKEEYGCETNLLKLTLTEYVNLDAYLTKLGVVSRITTAYYDKDLNDHVVVIQSVNPYNSVFVNEEDRERVKSLFLTKEAIRNYKR